MALFYKDHDWRFYFQVIKIQSFLPVIKLTKIDKFQLFFYFAFYIILQ